MEALLLLHFFMFVKRNGEEPGSQENPSAPDVGLTPREGQREGWWSSSSFDLCAV